MKYQISQMSLCGRILKLLASKHFEVGPISLRQMNAVIHAADLIVDALGKEDTHSTPGCGLQAWLKTDDVGMSSKFLACILAGGPDSPNRTPQDPNDFIRCEVFFDAVPAARDKLKLMKFYGPRWDALIENWDKIKALIDEEIGTGRCEKAYDFMQTLPKGN